VIGNALYRILKFSGHTVLSDNHVGDWGTQFGMIIYGYKHFRDDSAYQRDPVPELSRLYRLVNQISDFHKLVESLPRLREQLPVKESAVMAAKNSVAANSADKDLVRIASVLRRIWTT